MCENDIFDRRGFAWGIHNDRFIFVAGGCKKNDLIRSAAMYDIQTQKYITLPDLPWSGCCTGTIWHEYFYVMFSGRKMYRLCTTSSLMTWEEVDNDELIKDRVYNFISDGKYLYFFKGENKSLLLAKNIVFRYDPMTNRMAQMPPIPGDLILPSKINVSVGNHIYVIGTFCYDDIYAFDTIHHKWSIIPPIPEPFPIDAATVVLDRWIVVFGKKESFVYDTLHQTWMKTNLKTSPPYAFKAFITYGSQIICIGGRNKSKNHAHGGCYIQSIPAKCIIPGLCWELVKDYLLLRQLVDDTRAHPIISEIKRGNRRIFKMKCNQDEIICKIFTGDVPLDIFRNVLSFLI